MKNLILHLSDIHIKNERDPILSKYEEIASATYRFLPEAESLLIAVSGDIAFSGEPRQYNLAKDFISSILRSIKKEKDLEIRIIFVPGNHDCDFSLSSSVRESVLKIIRSEGEDVIDDEIIQQCCIVQKEYFDFEKENTNVYETSYEDNLWKQYRIQFSKKIVILDCINMSWMSEKEEKYGETYFPLKKYKERIFDKSDLRIVILHQPPNWIDQEQYHDLRSMVRKIGDIVLMGHEHHQSASEINNIHTSKNILIEGAALQGHDKKFESGFNMIEINLDSNEYLPNLFEFDGSMYICKKGNKEWSSFRELPNKFLGDFALQSEFNNFLVDPGANYCHSKKNKISLNDIFIYPDLEKLDGNNKRDGEISSIQLIDTLEFGKGVLIKGDEKSGKTALFKTLFLNYHDSGLLPLYIDGEKIKNVSSKFLLKLSNTCIGKQYGNDKLEAWNNISKEQKILFIDGFDRSKVADKFRPKILEYFCKYFRTVIISADYFFDITEATSVELSKQLGSLTNYRIKPFGYKLRHELVKKWGRIGNDASFGTKEIISHIDRTEKVFDSVLVNNLVPRVPFYLITILQSMASPSTSNLQSSTSGHYYHYLITDALTRSNIDPVELDEYFNYCSQLAWFYKQSGNSELDYLVISKFNDVYSDQFFSVDCSNRLLILCNARIMKKRGDIYTFCYQYQFYYFLTKFLSENLHENQEVEQLITRAAKHIYIKDNSNIILFLIHHTKEAFIIDEILENLKLLFSNRDPIRFEDDTQVLNDLVKETTRLVYRERDPEDYRKKESKIKDEYEVIDEEDDKTEKELKELDLGTKIDMLFKTVDILGQLVKNYYGSMKKSRKREVLSEVYNAPLRALRDFFIEVEDFKEAIIIDIENKIKQKKGSMKPEKKRNLAKKIVFNYIGMITFAFVSKSVSSSSSENIMDVVRETVDNNPTTALKLFGLAAKLDNPTTIPFDDIQNIAIETEKNIFAHRLLETIVLRHLYLFKVTEPEKQRLCSMLGMKYKQQEIIRRKKKK